jgi:hypothetical protein
MKKLFVLFFLILFVSCSPCKRLQKRCPPQVITERVDSIVVKDTVIYRDKIIPFPIPGKTDTITEYLEVKEQIPEVRLENDYAWAKAWVENSRLKMMLHQKEQVINLRLDSAYKEVRHWKEKYETDKQKEIVVQKVIPKFYKFTAKFFFVFLIITFVYIYIKYKSKAWVGLKKLFSQKP